MLRKSLLQIIQGSERFSFIRINCRHQRICSASFCFCKSTSDIKFHPRWCPQMCCACHNILIFGSTLQTTEIKIAYWLLSAPGSCLLWSRFNFGENLKALLEHPLHAAALPVHALLQSSHPRRHGGTAGFARVSSQIHFFSLERKNSIPNLVFLEIILTTSSL